MPRPETFCCEHPDRPATLRCGACDRPACADCLTVTCVGQRCVACANPQPVDAQRPDGEQRPVAAVASADQQRFLAATLIGVLACVLLAPVSVIVGPVLCAVSAVRGRLAAAPALVAGALYSCGYWLAVAAPLLRAAGLGDGAGDPMTQASAQAIALAGAAAVGFAAFMWRPATLGARELLLRARPRAVAAGLTVACGLGATAVSVIMAVTVVVSTVS